MQLNQAVLSQLGLVVSRHAQPFAESSALSTSGESQGQTRCAGDAPQLTHPYSASSDNRGSCSRPRYRAKTPTT